ncbi:MAG: TetR/AcrR family transcriptional regulator [Candidatus Hydrogenedentes bacterium]|nr:TetR/AcrR family transcriptional regulator [Candidatus Hydrogenedentota bacterium]
MKKRQTDKGDHASDAPLVPRRTPTQARGRQRVDAILDATAELLVERGFEAVTTGHIAERARIPVGSIYQYFPNKYAVFIALATRQAEQFGRITTMLSRPETIIVRWGEVLDRLLEAIVDYLLSDPAIPVLWAGLVKCPELRLDDVEYHAKAVDYTFAFLAQLLPDMPDEKRAVVGMTVYAVSEALFFRLCQESAPQKRQLLLNELKVLLKGYLAYHMNGD